MGVSLYLFNSFVEQVYFILCGGHIGLQLFKNQELAIINIMDIQGSLTLYSFNLICLASSNLLLARIGF